MGNLVLRRRVGESLVLFDAGRVQLGTLTVVAVEGDRVKLAARFRGDITILREELVGREREDNDEGGEMR